jgi:putative SOS response-associated peptidase YedK
MCCRYLLEESPELRPIIEEMNRSPLAGRLFPREALRSGGEVRPSDVAPVLAPDRSGRRTVFPMKWGFRAKTLIVNARAETAAERPLFRESWQSRRCAVPSSCYFEWEHPASPDGRRRTGTKYRLQEKDAPLTWLCGLYRMEEGIPCFVVLTRAPGENIRFIHDRMPLILPESAVEEWIRPETRPEDLLSLARTDLIFRPAV